VPKISHCNGVAREQHSRSVRVVNLLKISHYTSVARDSLTSVRAANLHRISHFPSVARDSLTFVRVVNLHIKSHHTTKQGNNTHNLCCVINLFFTSYPVPSVDSDKCGNSNTYKQSV